MYNIDDLVHTIAGPTDGKWVIARPVHNCDSLKSRIKDAIGVLTHRYDAVKFYKQ